MARKELTLEDLVAGVRAADRRALARAISLVEDGDPLAYPLVRELYPSTGHAAVVGVTGPPGVGKSSLIGALVGLVREREQTVGVVSVDPSSPFTRGALLGDRIRCSTLPGRTSSSSRRSARGRARSRSRGSRTPSSSSSCRDRETRCRR